MDTTSAAAIGDVSQQRNRRARAACELCRSKKVRCDARGGRACSNCTFDNLPCVLSPRGPRKNANSRKSTSTQSRYIRPRGSEDIDVTSLVSRPVLQNEISDQPHAPSTSQHEDVARLQDRPPAPETSPSGWTETFSIPEDPRIWTSNGQDRSFAPSQGAYSHFSQSGPAMSKTPEHVDSFVPDIPNYIKPFPPSIEMEDLHYLQKKGVFALPDSHLRDSCLRCYLRHVHPIYPIIDPVTVAPMLKDGNNKNGKISLLLMYALVFVGSTWIDVRLVRKLGFLSRRAFRKSIHRKMRLLYDADYETDRLCLIQVFILWTFWFEGPNENKDGWHWIGVAFSLSRVIGLHQATPDTTDARSSLDHFRRRLWWCLATRDVICSFALSRCPRVADVSHNVTMIGIEDFDFSPMPAILQESNSQSLCQQQTLAHICVHYFKLVSIFGKICKAAYPESGSGKSSVLYSSEQLEGMDSIGSDGNLSVANQLKMFQTQLDEWRREVPDNMWHDSSLLSNLDGAERVEQVHRGLLSMMYYATVMILHRPQMGAMSTVGHSVDVAQSTTPDPPRVLVRFAAMQMTQIAMDFYQEDLVESLAATCISCLILASISHIFDMMSVEQAVQSEARKKLEQCQAIFHAFSDQQAGGQWGLEVIDYIVFRLKHQQRHRNVDVMPLQANANNLNIEGGNKSSISGVVNPQDQLQRTHLLAATNSSRKHDTNSFGNGSSGTSHIPVFPSPRQPLGFNESFLPGLSLDQPLPDNLMSFLGPDISWLEFPNPSENLDGMSWSGTVGG